jgi:NAD(P)-dependent dehydrogenase (short-subunit alcohol dehydrogenase family)
VTGAASGLGRVFAHALSGAGADVMLIDINLPGLEETAAHVRAKGQVACTHVADVADEAQVAAAFEAIHQSAGRVDILVNNAGIGERFRGMLHEYPSSDWHRMVEVNLNSVFFCSRAALQIMLPSKKGKIINIASMWGLVGAGIVNAAGYAATKGAVVNLTREMAVEYAPHGIQINAICPGFHRTSLTNFDDPERLKRMTSHTPAGRVAAAEELQGSIVYLASSASDYMCGSILVVDGGFLAK